VCGSSARTDLYGGQPAMTVPTVTRKFTSEYGVGSARFSKFLSVPEFQR
jgi:hypothetical protein